MKQLFNKAHDILLGERHAHYRKQKERFVLAVNALVLLNEYEIRYVDYDDSWHKLLKLTDTTKFSHAALFVYPASKSKGFIVVSNSLATMCIHSFLKNQNFDLLGKEYSIMYSDLDYYCYGGNNLTSYSEKEIIAAIIEKTKKLESLQIGLL